MIAEDLNLGTNLHVYFHTCTFGNSSFSFAYGKYYINRTRYEAKSLFLPFQSSHLSVRLRQQAQNINNKN